MHGVMYYVRDHGLQYWLNLVSIAVFLLITIFTFNIFTFLQYSAF